MYIIVGIKSNSIIGVTSDEDPFKFMDGVTGSNFNNKPFTIKEDIYFKLRYKGILRFSSVDSDQYDYYIIDPVMIQIINREILIGETTLLFLTGYDPIELLREAKIEIINQ